MDILQLSPLPSEFSEDTKSYRRMEEEGFVDESAVLAVIAKGGFKRVYAKPDELVLSSSPDDFAGWALPVESPFRKMVAIEGISVSEDRSELKYAVAPVLPVSDELSFELGISESREGGHRWWLFGASGAMCCGILSLMLLSLAQRPTIAGTIADYTPEVPNLIQNEIVMPESVIEPALVGVDIGR